MSDGSLSQEEIDALLHGGDSAPAEESAAEDSLSPDEIDTIGEIANICMGTAATALFSLVNKKVEISTPVVSYSDWESLEKEYEKPCVMIRITYTKGLFGSNVLVLKERDVKVITDLMMGGDGTNTDSEITDIHLSAISEAMNQMMGSSATSLSSMLNKVIDISPPESSLIDLNEPESGEDIDSFLKERFIKIEFHLQIGDLVDSKLMQLYPISLAKKMVENVKANMENDSNSTVDNLADGSGSRQVQNEPPVNDRTSNDKNMNSYSTGNMNRMNGMVNDMVNDMDNGMNRMNGMNNSMNQMNGRMNGMNEMNEKPVNVSAAQFSPLSSVSNPPLLQENIDLIKDVPLEVTVELGRTKKSIQDILDFAPGTIIELNKIAGEPIDVLVNGKYVAKGEVVVIEESFGIRITEILK